MSAIMNFINQYRELESLDKIDAEIIKKFYERIINDFHLKYEKEESSEKQLDKLDRNEFNPITNTYKPIEHRDIIFDSILLFIEKYINRFRGKTEGEFFKYFYSIIRRSKDKKKVLRENEMFTDENGLKKIEQLKKNKISNSLSNPDKDIVKNQFGNVFNECVKNLPEDLKKIIEIMRNSLLKDDKLIKKKELASKIETDASGMTRRFKKIRNLLWDCLNSKGYSDPMNEM